MRNIVENFVLAFFGVICFRVMENVVNQHGCPFDLLSENLCVCAKKQIKFSGVIILFSQSLYSCFVSIFQLVSEQLQRFEKCSGMYHQSVSNLPFAC